MGREVCKEYPSFVCKSCIAGGVGLVTTMVDSYNLDIVDWVLLEKSCKFLFYLEDIPYAYLWVDENGWCIQQRQMFIG